MPKMALPLLPMTTKLLPGVLARFLLLEDGSKGSGSPLVLVSTESELTMLAPLMPSLPMARKCEPICVHTSFGRSVGGGGGTFGLVTDIHYKLHPKTKVVNVNWGKVGTPPSADVINQSIKEYLTYCWIKISPVLDNRWSGFWKIGGYL